MTSLQSTEWLRFATENEQRLTSCMTIEIGILFRSRIFRHRRKKQKKPHYYKTDKFLAALRI